jgi:hypothetical protein
MTGPHIPDADPRLREALGRLPEEMPPERDLWPEIRAQLDAERVRVFPGTGTHTDATVASTRPRPALGVRGSLAAAAALVLVTATVTVTVTWQLRGPTARDEGNAGAPNGIEATAGGLASFASYERSAAELSALLDERTARLDPATRVVLERSLRTIDAALAEARAALAEDPASPGARAFVETVWRQKLDFLRRANDVATLRGI